MQIVQVHVHVKPECVDAFINGTVKNARQSVLEPGIARFDLLQQTDDPTRFVILEAYRTADAPAAHKQTAHYAEWRDAVPAMQAEERTRVFYKSVFPGEQGH